MTTIVALSLPPPSSFNLLLLLLSSSSSSYAALSSLSTFHHHPPRRRTASTSPPVRLATPCASLHLLLLLLLLLYLRVIRCSRLLSHHLQHIPPLPTLDSKPRCVPHLSNDLLLMLYQLNPANRLRVCNSAGWLPGFLRV